MTRTFKYILLCISILFLNACATGTMYDTKRASARSQGLFVDPAHDGKDVVVVFPMWTSEADKIIALNSNAQIKASQVCPGVSYNLTGVYSSPANPTTNWATTRASAISANIQCGVVGSIPTASSSTVQTGIVETEYCKNLLQTNIYKWTSECSVRTGTGSQIIQPQAIRYSNQTEVDLYTKRLPKNNLPTCPGGEVLLWAASNIYRDWSNCFGTLIYSRSDTLSTSSYREERYIGVFKDGRPDGLGTYYYETGNVYIGQFQNGQPHGQGILINVDSKSNKEGIWERNVFKYSQKINFQNLNTSEKIQTASKVESNNPTTFVAPVAPQTAIPAASAQMMNPGRRIALVIGNQNYNVRPLSNPRNDADDMSRALKNAGFEVIDVRDASLPQMRNAVRQFGDRLLTRDVGLVYYSGHGIEVRGRNYFIPVNADIKRSDEIADQSLDVNLILEKMETAKKGVNILIVDACRDDPFGRSFRSGSKGLATMDAPQGTIIAFATSPGKVAADGEGRNSPYTKNLIKAMQVPNLPIEQVFKQVRRAVQQETKNQQTPWENTSLSGDFYFSVKK